MFLRRRRTLIKGSEGTEVGAHTWRVGAEDGAEGRAKNGGRSDCWIRGPPWPGGVYERRFQRMKTITISNGDVFVPKHLSVEVYTH